MTPAVMDNEDFHHFYAANYGDTVAMTYGFTADLGEAQDIAQEAFARAWQRWREVSRYDNPVAWVRRVATNLAHSRWRRLKIATAYLLRERPPEPVAAVDPDHVAVVAALRKLPMHHREALVLHYLLDMPVNDVAEQLDVPIGTVKSWLHRGRSALAGDLRIDVRASVATPPPEAVVGRARKLRRARAITAASAVFLVTAGVLVGVKLVGLGATEPPPLTAAPSSTLDPNDPMLGYDWSRATIALGSAGEACPGGNVQFAPSDSGWIIGPERSWPQASFQASQVALGDLTGDGQAEAVLTIVCSVDPDSDDRPFALLVAQLRPGGLHALGWVGRPSSIVLRTWISDGVLYADSRPHPSSQTWQYELGRVDGWRWDGNGFAEVATAGRYPPIRRLDLTPVAADLACEGTPETTTPTPGVDDAQLYTTDGKPYAWHLRTYVIEEIFAEFGRLGRPYLFLPVGCREDVSLVLFDLDDGGVWKPVTVLDPGPGHSARVIAVDRDTVTVQIRDADNDSVVNAYQLAAGDTLVPRPITPTPSR